MGINLVLFGSQLVSFLILFFVLSRWVFPLLIKTLDKRALTIQEGVRNAEQARLDLAAAETRIQGMMEEARKDAQHALDQARKAGEQIRASIEQDARANAGRIVQQAQAQTQQLVAQARVELRQQVADLAIMAAEHVIGNSMDTTTNRRLVSEFVARTPDGAASN
ncbi:MAG TPA: F0F1 ATP synthase subunit B [Ktedonobacterales bacterium]|nr:F0F1 ATP synthase subunit B [Ktedonobacterales bacterium]